MNITTGDGKTAPDPGCYFPGMSATRWNANRVGRFARSCRGLPGYHLSWLGRDAVAGIAVWRLWPSPPRWGLPSVAMVPVQVGLYALPAALVLYAVFGSSRQVDRPDLDGGALMSGAVVAGLLGHEDPGRAIIAVQRGRGRRAWLALFGILRLGCHRLHLTAGHRRFPASVSTGVIAGELPHMLGVPRYRATSPNASDHLGELGQTSLTVALAVGGLALLFLGDARRPPSRGRCCSWASVWSSQGRGIPPTMASR